jgi:hypothetical protein
MFFDPHCKPEVEVKLEPWRQQLLDAADYMEQHGHCKRTMQDYRGRVCLYGAIHAIIGREILPVAATAAVSRYLGFMIPSRTANMLWNDASERTQDEVVAALRGAAKL